MLRRRFTFASALSLVLCIVSLFLWARTWQWVVGEMNGSLVFCYCHGPGAAGFLSQFKSNSVVLRYLDVGPSDWHPSVGSGRISPGRFIGPFSFPYWYLSVPYWWLALGFALLPYIWLTAHVRRRRRSQAGHCLQCGYDLRGTADRCPECGTSVTKKSGAVA